MFRSIAAIAFVAAVISTSTSAVAQSYTGQIHSDSYGRYETIVVKPGDNIWKLSKHFQWGRFNYETVRNAEAVDFEHRVKDLNPGINIHRIRPGQVINFPLPYGTAQELNKQDNLRAALNKKAGELAEQNARKDGVIADLRKQISELTQQVQNLLGLNTTLTKTVADQKAQIGNQKKQIGGLEESLSTFQVLFWIVLAFLVLFILLAGVYTFKSRREESQPDLQLAPQTAHASRVG